MFSGKPGRKGFSPKTLFGFPENLYVVFTLCDDLYGFRKPLGVLYTCW
jgi:hypothetical protein